MSASVQTAGLEGAAAPPLQQSLPRLVTVGCIWLQKFAQPGAVSLHLVESQNLPAPSHVPCVLYGVPVQPVQVESSSLQLKLVQPLSSQHTLPACADGV